MHLYFLYDMQFGKFNMQFGSITKNKKDISQHLTYL